MRELRVLATTVCTGFFLLLAQIPAVLAGVLQLDIPAQPLRSALAAVSQAADVQLLYDTELTEGRHSLTLRGEYILDAALAELLADTGLRFVRSGEAIVIVRNDDVRLTPPLRIAGLQAAAPRGANGSSDSLATEGSGQYAARGASVGSPYPQVLADNPRSVAVLGSEQMRDQGLVELADALRQLPGVSVRGRPVDEAEVRVRAFVLSEYQVDGGAVRSSIEGRFRGDADIYDRIELLRGSDGLGHGYASPAGLLNLVRKRPLDRQQVLLEARAGSWNAYRGMLDVSAPLGWDGRLRGRAVVSSQDREYFYDTADLHRRSAYGIVEADLTSATLLAAGVYYVDQRTTPWEMGGLPPQVQAAAGISRHRSYVLPWERDDLHSTNLFMTIDQSLGRDWQLRLVVDEIRDDEDRLIATIADIGFDPESGDGFAFFGPLMSDIEERQSLVDFKLRGRFRWNALEQRVAANVHRATEKITGRYYVTDQDSQFRFVNLYSFDASDYPAPQALGLTEDSPRFGRIQRRGAALTLDLSFWEPLRVIGAWRWTSYEERYAAESLMRAEQDRHGAPSYFGVVWSLAPLWTVYASWADIHQTNADHVGPGGSSLDPMTGRHYETGVKFDRDGTLLGTFALFRVEQTGFTRLLAFDAIDPRCCYDLGADQRVISEGIELGLSGNPYADLQLTAGYVYSRNAIRGADALRAGDRYSNETPRHLLQLWARWKPRSEPWQRLTLGAGVLAQSESSWRHRVVFGPQGPASVTVAQGGYALASLLAAWKLDPHWEARFNIDNLFDREYDVSRGGVGADFHLHGMPRRLQLSLRGAF